ncbi:hypothetical protein BH18ACT9_BH18ACT9_16160 [soil metagenome]
MAKALLGTMSSTHPRVVDSLLAENARLRTRVSDLEAQLLRLQSENDSLAAAVHDEPLLTLQHA